MLHPYQLTTVFNTSTPHRNWHPVRFHAMDTAQQGGARSGGCDDRSLDRRNHVGQQVGAPPLLAVVVGLLLLLLPSYLCQPAVRPFCCSLRVLTAGCPLMRTGLLPLLCSGQATAGLACHRRQSWPRRPATGRRTARCRLARYTGCCCCRWLKVRGFVLSPCDPAVGR